MVVSSDGLYKLKTNFKEVMSVKGHNKEEFNFEKTY